MDAESGRRREAEPAPTAPEAVASPPYSLPLFAGWPLEHSAVPSGLANLSAAGCAACHVEIYATWAGSAHSKRPSERFEREVESVGSEACRACHLPLAPQHDVDFTFTLGPQPIPGASKPFSASLRAEAVTCAACHVRDGLVLSTRDAPLAPHPVQRAQDLEASSSCAACHQLVWADVAVYDTVGEWSRSSYAANGVGCTMCHGPASPGHETAAGVPVSLEVTADRRSLTRGGAPLDVEVRLLNTGAGHAFPTGGPYSAAELVAELVDAAGNTAASRLVVPLRRRFDADWRVVEDTRLAVGATAAWRYQPALTLEDGAGPWRLRVAVRRVRLGAPDEPPVAIAELPLRTD